MIPGFKKDGTLPQGEHKANWKEFCKRFGKNRHRKKLLNGLRRALLCLKKAGCKKVYINGSFVTSKNTPNDFDCCWDIDGVDPRCLDPILLTFVNQRAAQKAKYFGELFPAQFKEGITGKTWLEFFQVNKLTGKPKGIITIDLRSDPL